MPKSDNDTPWTRHFVYRREQMRTTWKLRIGLLALMLLAVWFTRAWWIVAVARSLVCEGSSVRSDAILVENFDPNYPVFQRAGQLRLSGLAARVFVPIQSDPVTSEPNAVALGTAELMAKLARVGPIEIIPIKGIEPISLNAGYDVLRLLQREHIHSVVVVSPLFRSRRSALVYGATLGRAGIAVSCEPMPGIEEASKWTQTWHGMENVAEQWFKLQYYRWYVLPFRLRPEPSQQGVFR